MFGGGLSDTRSDTRLQHLDNSFDDAEMSLRREKSRPAPNNGFVCGEELAATGKARKIETA